MGLRMQPRHETFVTLFSKAGSNIRQRERIPMKRAYRKRSYPLDEIRQFLEPGPIVLVSSAWQSFKIMTMGGHMMLGFSPALASDLSGPAEQARMAEKKSHV
jgi:hypothetical protein